MTRFVYLNFLLLIFYNLVYSQSVIERDRTFEVDYNNSQFLKDGAPFKYVAGEMHYFRIPHQYWEDRLRKLKAIGANTVQTYIEWSVHEPSPNDYKFEGQHNVAHFIRLAQKAGLNVIIRPGPYICAEREFGGYPAWLLTINPNVKLRTSDPSHTFFVARWFKHLMAQIVPLLYGNGGPIIMVQVENEYGSYPTNDQHYLIWLRDLYRSYVKDAAVLFTTDGSSTYYIQRGRIPGVFTTVDFGSSLTDILTIFAPLRQYQPLGPLVNSEFYVGWLSYWGRTFATVDTKSILYTMESMLKANVSFSMYMFHGGTNFGFSAGSGSDSHYLADLTSYDYDAPLSEAGDITPKYKAIQNLLSKYFPVLDIEPEVEKKGDYGTVTLDPLVNLFESSISLEPVLSQYPPTFEEMDQSFGFMSYETVTNKAGDPSVLQVNQRDRAVIFVNDREVGVLMYTYINELPLPPSLTKGDKLRILVENMGRRNYQLLTDCTKGIISNATIDGVVQQYWNITGYPLHKSDIMLLNSTEITMVKRLPAFFRGRFQAGTSEEDEPLDTYLNLSGWGKGVAFVNGHNLGRYWHVGPQVTLYVPAVYLNKYPEQNTIILLELHYTNPSISVTFQTTPYLNSTVST